MIVLYNPKSNNGGQAILPMAMMAMGALLEGKHGYVILDGNLPDEGPARVLATLETTGADIVAITVMAPGPQLIEAVPLCREIKDRFPKVKIIWGGYFPTLYPAPVKDSGFVDFFMRGHADLSFLDLIEKIRCGDAEFRDLPNLSWPESRKGPWIDNPIGPVPDMNALPGFPYHAVDMEKYVRSTFLGSRTVAHHSSYGCPFKCNFCGVVNMVDGKYDAQSAENTAAVVSRLVDEFGANAVEFYDSNFLVQEKRVAKFCDLVTPLGITWWCFGRIDTMMKFSDSTWRKMRDSGLAMVFMGAETGSDETLKIMNKGGKQTTDQTLELAARMRKFNIRPEFAFVFGNPPDPENDINITFEFIKKVKKVNSAAEIIFYIYTPVPLEGTMSTLAAATGFEYPKSIDDWVACKWMDSIHHRTSDLPWLEPRTVKRIQNYRIVLQSAYPTKTDPSLRGAKRLMLRMAGMWRYKLSIYALPYELKLINRIFPHQRPETAGF